MSDFSESFKEQKLSLYFQKAYKTQVSKHE
jgi:hypothetical protein